jgi:cytochrome oxidase Cu insertion factor (SCO1/SenC/PrrC family)
MALRLARVEKSVPANLSPTPNLELAQSVVIEDSPTGTDYGSGTTSRMVIPDVEVLDQSGTTIHFYSDLIKGKTVAINFIFTTCTTICPPLAATFARVQKELGDKVGREVYFISISVDPLTDTPERLKAWGDKFKAGPGWTFVTGNKQEIGQLLNALGAAVARREDHSPTVIVGNDLKGLWTRTYGLAKPSQLIGLILNVIDRKTDQALTKELGKP